MYFATNWKTGELLWGEGLYNSVQQWVGLTDSYAVLLSKPDSEDRWDILVYDRFTGELMMTHPMTREFGVYLSDSVMAISYPELGITQGIDYLTGELIWENTDLVMAAPNFEYGLGGSVSLLFDQTLVWNRSPDSVAVDMNTGTILWEDMINASDLRTMIKNPDNSSSFYAIDGPTFTLYDALSGRALFSHVMSNDPILRGFSQISEGVYIVESSDNQQRRIQLVTASNP
jgi:outer membrane protein assembly factor BamB